MPVCFEASCGATWVFLATATDVSGEPWPAVWLSFSPFFDVEWTIAFRVGRTLSPVVADGDLSENI